MSNATPSPATAPIGVAILGSTGSIGRQTLEVIDHHPERFRVVALTAGSNINLLAKQIQRYQPDLVAANTDKLDPPVAHPRLLPCPEGLIAAATHHDADIVVVATSGHEAILPTYRAIEAGKTIAIANKETIVCAGGLIMPRARELGVQIRPADSEHSAIWQCLGRSSVSEVSRLILTASGGPFRKTPQEIMERVTADEALAHPTWSMGGKITIDSATLMNKGLEVIEAHWLFGVPYSQIEVIVHPESIVHSLVEFDDGSQIAQLSLPDMRLPIQFALTYPEHLASPCRRLSLTEVGSLHFEPPDLTRFPALTLARRAGEAGRTYPTVLSAADEIAVTAFVAGKLRFTDIPRVIDETLEHHLPNDSLTFEAIAEADTWARSVATDIVQKVGTT